MKTSNHGGHGEHGELNRGGRGERGGPDRTGRIDGEEEIPLSTLIGGSLVALGTGAVIALALLRLCGVLAIALWLGGCVTVREREVIKFRTLPPKVIERVIMVVPDEVLESEEPAEPEAEEPEQMLADGVYRGDVTF